MIQVVWAAEYCDCVYESLFATLSIHGTAAGAYRAMMKHKRNAWSKAREDDLYMRGNDRRTRRKVSQELGVPFPREPQIYCDQEAWRIRKYEVQT